MTPLKFRGTVGISLLVVFALSRLSGIEPIHFVLLPFSLLVGAMFTTWFLYDMVKGWSEFSLSVLFSVFVAFVAVLMLRVVVTGTQLHLRSGLGPFSISLHFLFWMSLPFAMLLVASLPMFLIEHEGLSGPDSSLDRE